MKGKTRQANFELLRILAMMMVVVLHYFVKGQAAPSLVENTEAVNLITWFLKAMCVVTINLYVLISGYFLLEAKWKLSRLITIWLQTYVYSIGVPAVCFALGVGEVRQWGLYDWINVIFPVQMEHYWFITAYVILYLFIPVLSAGVKHMNKQQHGLVIAGLLLVFSVPKTILPIYIPIDRYGYDFGWFLCLFMIASYIRMYGMPFFNTKGKSFAVYFAAVAGIWLISVLCGLLSRKGLPLAYAMDMTYCYNHILVLIAAIALFYAFSYIHIPQGKMSELICKISPYTLGVYLLHENLAVRTRWQFWAGIEGVKGGFEIFPHMVVTVIAVFIAGIVVDCVRDCIFKSIAKIWKKYFAGKHAKVNR